MVNPSDHKFKKVLRMSQNSVDWTLVDINDVPVYYVPKHEEDYYGAMMIFLRHAAQTDSYVMERPEELYDSHPHELNII